MRLRRVCFSATSALAMALVIGACDGVALPGFTDPPKVETPEPPGQTPPPVDTGTEEPAQPDPVDPVTPSEPVDPPTDPVDPDQDTGEPPQTDPVDPTLPVDEPTDPLAPETPTEPDSGPAPTEPDPVEPVEPEPTEPEPVEPGPVDPEPVEPDPVPEPPVIEPAFSYHAPGALAAGSGLGSTDETVYAPDMVFPIKDARAYPQSMVFQPGGFRYEGPLPGDECIPENYEYPWQDNFCERGRPASFTSDSCPAGSGVHLGQDIRVGDGPTCEAMRRQYRNNPQGITNYKVVAAEDGVISGISTYTVTLRAGPRTYRYLHMNMRALQVSIGDEVTAGQHLGYVSKDFGSTSTTFHLHFVLKVNNGSGSVFVPPYTSLVESYARREGAPGRRIERNVNIAFDDVSWDPNEVFENIE